MRAEWTKMWSVPSTRWLPIAAVAVTVGLGALMDAFVAADARKEEGSAYDPFALVHFGLGFGQLLLLAFAVLTVSGEYSSGTIRPSLAAVPDRRTLMAAKLAVITSTAAAAAVTSSLLCTVLARVLMPEGHVSLAATITWQTAFGHAAYLVLLTVMCAGAAFVFRTPSAALGALVPLILLGTVLATAIPGVAEIGGFTPEAAGRRITRAREAEDYELGPWIGLIVMLGWAAAATLWGLRRLRTKDA
jgi:hypothetical protein